MYLNRYPSDSKDLNSIVKLENMKVMEIDTNMIMLSHFLKISNGLLPQVKLKS